MEPFIVLRRKAKEGKPSDITDIHEVTARDPFHALLMCAKPVEVATWKKVSMPRSLRLVDPSLPNARGLASHFLEAFADV